MILPQNATAQDFEEFNLNNRQINTLLKMKNEDAQFTYESYANQHDISKSTAKRDLNMMFDKNLIRRVTIKQTYYFFV